MGGQGSAKSSNESVIGGELRAACTHERLRKRETARRVRAPGTTPHTRVGKMPGKNNELKMGNAGQRNS